MNKKYTFFWKGPLSNWHESPFILDNIKFNCGEQYMMYSKAKLFNDNIIAERILLTKNPKIQKSLGRQIKNFNNEIWDKECQNIMIKGLKVKFIQNPKCLDILYEVRNTILVEASPFDRIWGIGFDARDAMKNIDNWGENKLGKILNQVIIELGLC